MDGFVGRRMALLCTSFLIMALVIIAVPASARNLPADNGVAVIGERNVTFNSMTGSCILKGPLESVGTVGKNSIVKSFTTQFDSYNQGLVSGTYNTTCTAGTISFAFTDATLTAWVTSSVSGKSGEEVTTVAKGDNVTLNATTNLNTLTGLTATIDLKLKNPSGVLIKSYAGVDFTSKDVSATGKVSANFSTTGLDTGTYTLSIETVKADCNGLDAEGAAIIRGNRARCNSQPQPDEHVRG